MKDKVNFKMPSIIIPFCLLLAVVAFMLSCTEKRIKTKEAVSNNFISSDRDTPVIGNDLYYLKHPYLTKGHQFRDENNYDSAIYYYKIASVKFLRESQWENYVWINSFIARLYLYVAGKDYKDALPYLETALEKGNKNLSSDHTYMATTYYYWGLYYYNKRLTDSSLESLNKALEIYLKNYKKDNIYTADVYDALGNVYMNLVFDNKLAEENYLKSIKIKEELPNEKKSNLTANYYNLVKVYFIIGDYGRAQSFCFDAIRNTQFVKNHRFYWLELLEGVLATIYSEQQINDKAISKLQTVIRINYENNGDKSYLPFYFTSLGDIYSKLVKYDSAIFYYQKALSLTGANTLFSNQEEQAATTEYSLGMAYLKLKNYKVAQLYLNKCLGLQLKNYGYKNAATAKTLQGIGSIYLEKAKPDSALKYFHSGLMACTKNFNDTSIYRVPIALTVNNSLTAFEVVTDKALLLKKLYYKDSSNIRPLKASLALYCLADTLMTLFKSFYDRETPKLIFNKENNSIYEGAIDCATLMYQATNENKYLDMVFNFMDKRKSSLLLEAVNEKDQLELAGVPLKDQRELKALQQELTFLQSQLEEENNKGNPEEPVLKAIHTRTNIIKVKFDSLHNDLIKNYPYYASIQHKQDTLNLRDVEAYSSQNNLLLLEYFWGEEAVYVLGIYKGKSEILKINRSIALDTSLYTFRRNLSRGYVYNTKEHDFYSFQKSSFYLYNALVKPILALFNPQIQDAKDKPDLVVIPDGPLFYIPMEALITTPGSGKEVDYQKLHYLVNSQNISYDYSTRFLLKNYNRPGNSASPRVLALSFSNDHALKNRLGKLNILRNADSVELPGSARELKAISTYMEGQFYMGDDATETVFKKEAPGYDILHLAVHGVADSLNSYKSKLVFKKNIDTLNDGNLYAYEIYSLPIKAKLAVLSACESGVGKLNTGEGMFSMARGFIYAGCPSVIISYWRVNDNSTELIISNFYKQISTGNRIDQSLQKAKLQYIKNADQRTAHPANWAAFVAIGNMTPLVKESGFSKPILLIAFIILLAISTCFVRRNYKLKKLS